MLFGRHPTSASFPWKVHPSFNGASIKTWLSKVDRLRPEQPFRHQDKRLLLFWSGRASHFWTPGALWDCQSSFTKKERTFLLEPMNGFLSERCIHPVEGAPINLHADLTAAHPSVSCSILFALLFFFFVNWCGTLISTFSNLREHECQEVCCFCSLSRIVPSHPHYYYYCIL